MKTLTEIAAQVAALPAEGRLRILATIYLRALFTKKMAWAFLGCLLALLLGGSLEDQFPTASVITKTVARIIGFSILGMTFVFGFLRELAAGAKSIQQPSTRPNADETHRD
ncbi:MAG TPA: hypothetical protein VL069_02680 [Opitutus sp.]|nr:hypothetical protein [Opitutus sp.]